MKASFDGERTQDRLDRELRRLREEPREGASSGFTDRVLRETLATESSAEPGERVPRGRLSRLGALLDRGVPRFVVALASVALAVFLGVAYSELRDPRRLEGRGAEEGLVLDAVPAESTERPGPVGSETPASGVLASSASATPAAETAVRLHDFVESQRRAMLESEVLALQEELERLRRLQAVRDSVIVVPGGGEFDYYIDLRPMLTQRTAGARPVAVPASVRPR